MKYCLLCFFIAVLIEWAFISSVCLSCSVFSVFPVFLSFSRDRPRGSRGSCCGPLADCLQRTVNRKRTVHNIVMIQ